MNSKSYSTFFFAFLISSTLAVIPEGEIQIGPVFDPAIASRFFGHKHFEGLFSPVNKGHLAKKVLLGVGVVGAGALAAGGAAVLAQKLHQHKGGFGGFGGGHHAPSPSYGSGWGWSGGNSAGHSGSVSSSYPSYNSYYSQPQVDYSEAYASAQSSSGEGYPSSSYPSSSYYTDSSYNGWAR